MPHSTPVLPIEPGDGPHGAIAVYRDGSELARAGAVLLLVHGRGGTAAGMLEMARAYLARPDLALVSPQAAHSTWYPFPFLAPVEENEPHLSSGLELLDRIVEHVEHTGIAAERLMLLGFSQGACLALEYAARRGRRFGGVVALSGGLIGSEVRQEDYIGDLDGMPAFLGCSDVDPHIPLTRFEESVAVLRAMGADVSERIYPGMGHTVNEDEIECVREMLARLLEGR